MIDQDPFKEPLKGLFFTSFLSLLPPSSPFTLPSSLLSAHSPRLDMAFFFPLWLLALFPPSPSPFPSVLHLFPPSLSSPPTSMLPCGRISKGFFLLVLPLVIGLLCLVCALFSLFSSGFCHSLSLSRRAQWIHMLCMRTQCTVSNKTIAMFGNLGVIDFQCNM